jgi:hypothetical protein
MLLGSYWGIAWCVASPVLVTELLVRPVSVVGSVACEKGRSELLMTLPTMLTDLQCFKAGAVAFCGYYLLSSVNG